MYKRMTQESSNNLDFGDGEGHGISGFGLENGTPDHGAQLNKKSKFVRRNSRAGPGVAAGSSKTTV